MFSMARFSPEGARWSGLSPALPNQSWRSRQPAQRGEDGIHSIRALGKFMRPMFLDPAAFRFDFDPGDE
jgi:hypothetical protein